MQKTKKIAIFVLSAMVIGSGAYIFRDNALFDGLASSALRVPVSFTCTESSLASQASTYRQTKIRYKKALVIQKTLEAQIAGKSGKNVSGEIKNPEETLKLLKRQILIYTRFIKKYETCTSEIHLQPSVSVGVMSGEAKVVATVSDYQELAGFEIASPKNLNTFLDSLQFTVRVTPQAGVSIDQWFLVSDGAGPSPCLASPSGDTVMLDCTMTAGIPISIPQNTRGSYRLGAHIVSVDQTVIGSIEITMSGLMFNEGRSGFQNTLTPILLHYGIIEKPPIPLPEPVKVPEIIAPEVIPIVTPPTEVIPEVVPPADVPPTSDTPVVTPPAEVIPVEVPPAVEVLPVSDASVVTPQTDTVPEIVSPINETPIVTPPAEVTPEVVSPADVPPLSDTPIVTPPADTAVVI